MCVCVRACVRACVRVCACENVCEIRANGADASMLRYFPRCALGLLEKVPFVCLMLASHFDITLFDIQ